MEGGAFPLSENQLGQPDKRLLYLDGLREVGKCAARYDYQPTDPLSLKERARVRVPTTSMMLPYCGIISPEDMLVTENDVVTSVSFPNGDDPFGASVEVEIEAAVPRGPVYRSILRKVE